MIFSVLVVFAVLGAASAQELPAPQSSAPIPADPLTEYFEEIERVVPLRSSGELQIINNRGDIVIEGWAQDKVKVRGRKRALAESPSEAKRLFAAIDLGHRRGENEGLELAAEYGRGLGIQERLRERAEPRASMTLRVLAPSNLPLRIWAVSGKVSVKSWKGPLEIRSASGEVRVESARGGKSLSVLCPACAIAISGADGPVRCMGGSGSVLLSDVEGPFIYVESGDGPVQAERINGEQLYVLKGGTLTVRGFNGHIEFHGQRGRVRIEDGRGFVSGRTTSGDISIGMSAWSFQDKALIESTSGEISLQLPRAFSAELDVRSRQGRVEVGIPLFDLTLEKSRGPVLSSASPSAASSAQTQHVQGIAGGGGELLRVYSDSGNIRVNPRKN
ncbi:MAG: DUF4097 domain-containing protein [Oligoflexia bacterium]|nr:DUF4097 domain-containing protein [Oligoflexia bacterium]